MAPTNGLLCPAGPSRRRTFFRGPLPGPADHSGREKLRWATVKGLQVQTQTDTPEWVIPQAATMEPRGSACPMSRSVPVPSSALGAQGISTKQVRKKTLSWVQSSPLWEFFLLPAGSSCHLPSWVQEETVPTYHCHPKYTSRWWDPFWPQCRQEAKPLPCGLGSQRPPFPLAPGALRNSRSFFGN